MNVFLILFLMAGAAGAVGLWWFLHNTAKVDSAIARATTLPSGVQKKMDSVVTGSGDAAQSAVNKAGTVATNFVDKAKDS